MINASPQVSKPQLCLSGVTKVRRAREDGRDRTVGGTIRSTWLKRPRREVRGHPVSLTSLREEKSPRNWDLSSHEYGPQVVGGSQDT